MLNNRVYMGEAVHKGTSYPGEQAAIVERTFWDIGVDGLNIRLPVNRLGGLIWELQTTVTEAT